MKIYGYADRELPPELIEPMELAEITLVAGPEELRQIASFLTAAAGRMESMGPAFSHEHLADKLPVFSSSPHFVVFNPFASELHKTER